MAFLAMYLAVAEFLVFTNPKEVRRASCANNLKMMGLALKMYANESPGQRFPRQMYYHDIEVDCDDPTYPSTSTEKQTHLGMMFHFDDMYPNYLPDLDVLVCPDFARGTREKAFDVTTNPITEQKDMHHKCADPERGWHMADDRYWYVSHLIDKTGPDSPVASISDFDNLSANRFADDNAPTPVNNQFATWLELALQKVNDDPETAQQYLDSDWDLRVEGFESAGNGSRSTLFRLREGAERLFETSTADPAIRDSWRRRRTIPLMYDAPTSDEQLRSHTPLGGHVVFMDGHVEFVKYPDRFPFNQSTATLADYFDTRPENVYWNRSQFFGCHCAGS